MIGISITILVNLSTLLLLHMVFDNILNGLNSLFGASPPDLDQLQQPFMSNPNLVREIMNSPAMQKFIK